MSLLLLTSVKLAVRSSTARLNIVRGFTTSHIRVGGKPMPPRPGPVDEDEFTEVFLKGSGPGGQKIVSQQKQGHCDQFSTLHIKTTSPLSRTSQS